MSSRKSRGTCRSPEHTPSPFRMLCPCGPVSNRQLLMWPGCFLFFVVAPFCPCSVSLVSRVVFAVVPGPLVCKVLFFCCAPLGAATFRRGQSKKKSTPRFFFAPAPGERQSNGASPSPASRRGRSKKTPWVVFFFFLLWPRAGAQRGFSFLCRLLMSGLQPPCLRRRQLLTSLNKQSES